MEEYSTLSTKYRPRRLKDLLGQDVTVRTLSNAIISNRVAPAFIFHGPTGCGKTSTARILAASLNCEKGESVNPCGNCDNCKSIMSGRSSDVIELDAASNSGIDEIRDVKKEAKYAPLVSKYKIFIIDEAHALTARAEEAMLKFLEEPPQSVKIILATTDKHKIKHTISARCQDYRFNPIAWPIICSHLKDICQRESINADMDSLVVIAKLSRGHLRDALQHLDRVILYANGEPITKDTVNSALGTIDESLYFKVTDAVIRHNYTDGVRTIQDILLNAVSMDAVLSGLLDHLHSILLIQIGESTAGLLYLSDEQKKLFIHQASLMNPDVTDDMISYLVNIHRGLSYNVSPQVLLDQFLLKSIRSHFRHKSIKQTEKQIA